MDKYVYVIGLGVWCLLFHRLEGAQRQRLARRSSGIFRHWWNVRIHFASAREEVSLGGHPGAESPRSCEALPFSVAKEAKVSDMEDDQLGDEDLVFLDNK